MKIEVGKYSDGKFGLKIDGELIMKHEKLSTIVTKIEKYLKLRYLPEEEGGFMKFFGR